MNSGRRYIDWQFCIYSIVTVVPREEEKKYKYLCTAVIALFQSNIRTKKKFSMIILINPFSMYRIVFDS